MELEFGLLSDNATVFPLFNSVTNLASWENETSTQRPLPLDMRFNDGHKIAILSYSLLMITSAIGNFLVLAAIVRLRRTVRLTRINLFLLNLAIADLSVTFFMMPLEIGWNATVSWDAGDAMCRIMSFLRIFGLYLSGFIIASISLDCYFAIVRPLGIADANRRARIMLICAWVGSIVCSLPQSYIFHLEVHPEFQWYEQCVTFNSFPSKEFELVYNFSGFFFLYIFPLLTIIICYSCILIKIYRVNAPNPNGEQLRRSSMAPLGRAKVRTLKMTVMIVATFFFCWTPYNIMSLWYWFDRKSALEVDPRIQKALFMFACTNSCVNPIIYGLFHFSQRPKSGTHLRSVSRRSRVLMRSANYTVRFRCGSPARCCIMRCGEGTGSSGGTSPSASSLRRNTNNNNSVQTRTVQRVRGRNETEIFSPQGRSRRLGSGNTSYGRDNCFQMEQRGNRDRRLERLNGRRSTLSTAV